MYDKTENTWKTIMDKRIMIIFSRIVSGNDIDEGPKSIIYSFITFT